MLVVALLRQAAAETSLPMDKGLPVLVKVAVAFVDISGFDENAGNFKATVDVRLRWEDLRLRRPAEEFRDPPKVYRGADALSEAARIWTPDIEISNQVGEASRSELGLRIFPDGRVELMRRVSGEFATAYDVGRFPFGTEKLANQARGARFDRRPGGARVRPGRSRFQPPGRQRRPGRMGSALRRFAHRAGAGMVWLGTPLADRLARDRAPVRARSSPRSSSRCSPRC